eukprot:13880997-Heterocapsa_arctica.AAC.1
MCVASDIKSRIAIPIRRPWCWTLCLPTIPGGLLGPGPDGALMPAMMVCPSATGCQLQGVSPRSSGSPRERTTRVMHAALWLCCGWW